MGNEHDGHFLMSLFNEGAPRFGKLFSENVVLFKKGQAEPALILFDSYSHDGHLSYDMIQSGTRGGILSRIFYPGPYRNKHVMFR